MLSGLFKDIDVQMTKCFMAKAMRVVLLLVSILSCSCKVMEALYVLKTLAVKPGMRELRCLFSTLVCNERWQTERR